MSNGYLSYNVIRERVREYTEVLDHVTDLKEMLAISVEIKDMLEGVSKLDPGRKIVELIHEAFVNKLHYPERLDMPSLRGAVNSFLYGHTSLKYKYVDTKIKLVDLITQSRLACTDKEFLNLIDEIDIVYSELSSGDIYRYYFELLHRNCVNYIYKEGNYRYDFADLLLSRLDYIDDFNSFPLNKYFGKYAMQKLHTENCNLEDILTIDLSVLENRDAFICSHLKTFFEENNYEVSVALCNDFDWMLGNKYDLNLVFNLSIGPIGIKYIDDTCIMYMSSRTKNEFNELEALKNILITIGFSNISLFEDTLSNR